MKQKKRLWSIYIECRLSRHIPLVVNVLYCKRKCPVMLVGRPLRVSKDVFGRSEYRQKSYTVSRLEMFYYVEQYKQLNWLREACYQHDEHRGSSEPASVNIIDLTWLSLTSTHPAILQDETRRLEVRCSTNRRDGQIGYTVIDQPRILPTSLLRDFVLFQSIT